jgi:FkbM family methyltransferase
VISWRECSQRNTHLSLGLHNVRRAAASFIARHRRSRAITGLHRLARFYEAAWHNEGSDFATNGERFVLERLRTAGFRLAFDVGANVGDWSVAVAGLWPDCRVHAFEVAPDTFAALQARVAARPDLAVTCHRLGLSDRTGAQPMYYFPDAPKLTSDTRRHAQQRAVEFAGELTTLDAFCRAQGIDAIDFLKIDVEGAEHRVLKGAAESLARRRIKAVQFEYGAFSIDTRFLLKDYFAVLGERFHIGKIYPTYVDFADYDWHAEDFRFANYLGISRDHPELRQLLGS